jgi:rRNA-processing protein FCF1
MTIKTKYGKTDDLITELADKKTIIATQDKELRRRLGDISGTIGIRQKKYLYIRKL